ncbi:MAG: hypothetical protein IJ150_01445 [Bacteroidales bacterium]|nr:hypothetical protein [Bacteroidales bacterium]
MKHLFLIIIAGILIWLSACSPTQMEQQNKTDNDTKTNQENVQHTKNVYSLFYNEKDFSYQVFHNDKKQTSFRVLSGEKPVAADIFANDFYVLFSGFNKDSAANNSVIMKNGKPIIFFNKGFLAVDFCVKGCNFYVLGIVDDSIAVFKNGSKRLVMPKGGLNPLKISVQDDDNIFFALESNGNSQIYKQGELLYSYDGQCEGLQSSNSSLYAMVSNKIYCDGKIFMEGGNNYDFLKKQLSATPTCFATSDRYCYIGVDSKLETNGHTLAGIFRYREPYITIKPDDKALGKSDLQSQCCAISACNNGVYYATINYKSNGRKLNNIHYHFNTEEIFSINIPDETTKLLYIKGY